jgi:hypothetical protein
MRIGLLAEDRTDADAVKVLIKRILGNHVSIKPKCGKGCARLRAKARPHMRDLASEGYSTIIVLHDLDRNSDTNCLNDESTLEQELEGIETPKGVQRLICIPIEELEAWFWCDQHVLDEVGSGAHASQNPHNIARPKEKLQWISRGANKKPRYSTNDNARLCEMLDLDLCAKKCTAFAKLRDFVIKCADQDEQGITN